MLWAGSRPRRRAFTLTEALVASSVFLLVVAGVLIGNSFGMRIVGITQPKLAAAAKVRTVVNTLYADISSAKFVRVGDGDLSSFAAVGLGYPKQGNAIEIYPSADTNLFIRYYLDTGDRKLKRITNGAANATIIANALTNSLVFTGEDFAGRTLTNNQNNMVIGVTLQYSELDGTATPIGAGSYYKSYLLTNRIAWRAR